MSAFFSSGDSTIKPVFRRETGDLLLFRWDCVQILRAGPPPQAWVKTAKEPYWKPNRGGDALSLRAAHFQVRRYRAMQTRAVKAGLPRPSYPRFEALEGFLQLIPDEMLKEIVKFRRRHWHLYGLFARGGPAALELSRSNNRALAFALASAWCFARPVRWELRRARALLRHKRKHIAAALGFPPTRAAVRVLAKVVPESIDVRPLLFLRDALNQSDLARKRLAHVGQVNCGVIRLLTSRFAAHLSTTLLDDVGKMRSCAFSGHDVHRLVEDTLAMCRDLGRPLPVIRSYDHLLRLHAGSIDHIRARGPHADCTFDPPPLPPAAGLQAIHDARTLWMEGDQMRHCVSSYRHDIMAGNIYVYRVLKGDGRKRCTLAIGRDRRGRWEVVDLKSKCNASPGQSARAFVDTWLARQGQRGEASRSGRGQEHGG